MRRYGEIAKVLSAWDDREAVGLHDLDWAEALVLPHRRRRQPRC